MKFDTLFLYPDYYDSTTATRRILTSSKDLFGKIKFVYWARAGTMKENKESIFDGIAFEVFTDSAPPRSISVLLLFVRYQFWAFKKIFASKPQLILAFTFYSIFPSLIYRYFFNWKCRVVYDPRDYVAVCYRINKFVVFALQLLDNLFIQLSDFVIFPDRQYFNYYGFFKMKKGKYFILPNSTQDQFAFLPNMDFYGKYGIPRSSIIVPLIGYFAETRGRNLYYQIIKEKIENVHYVVAGEIRDKDDLHFFTSQPNVTFMGKISYLESLCVMKNSVFTPLLYDPVSLNNRYAYPTKYYDSLMVGTPLLVSYGQIDVWNAVRENNVGWGIEYNNVDDFRNLLKLALQEKLLSDRQQIRQVFLEKYDFNYFRDGLRNSYKKLTRNQA